MFFVKKCVFLWFFKLSILVCEIGVESLKKWKFYVFLVFTRAQRHDFLQKNMFFFKFRIHSILSSENAVKFFKTGIFYEF